MDLHQDFSSGDFIKERIYHYTTQPPSLLLLLLQFTYILWSIANKEDRSTGQPRREGAVVREERLTGPEKKNEKGLQHIETETDAHKQNKPSKRPTSHTSASTPPCMYEMDGSRPKTSAVATSSKKSYTTQPPSPAFT